MNKYSVNLVRNPKSRGQIVLAKFFDAFLKQQYQPRMNSKKLLWSNHKVNENYREYETRRLRAVREFNSSAYKIMNIYYFIIGAVHLF